MSQRRVLTARCASGVAVARYYDPQTAQFLTRDPIEAITGSAYGYAGGSPLDGSDPSGLCSLFSWGGDGCVAAAAAAVPGGGNLDSALTSFVSFGDQVTLGASRAVRHHIGLAGAVDECSGAYNSPVVTGAAMVAMLADGEGEALAAKSVASMADEGRLIAGPGGAPFRDVARVVEQYGGSAQEWAKMSSRKFVDAAGRSFETHWVQNLVTGARTEFKTKFLQGLGYYG